MSGGGAARARRIAARLALAAAALLVLLLAAAAALYLGRLELARRAALAWFRGQGVEGEVQLKSLGPTRLRASVRLGPKDRPDLAVDDAEVSYSLDSFLSGHGLKVSAVRLNRPVLNATWRNGRLGLGSIDRLVEALKPQPGAPPQPPPRVEVRGGLVRLQTDYGLAAISADADLAQGRLDRLDASLAPTSLRFGQATVQVRSVLVRATRSGDRLRFGSQAQFAGITLAQGSATGGEAGMQADLDYAALANGRIQGRIAGQATVASASAGDLAATGLKLDLQVPDLAAAPATGTGSARFHLRAAITQLTQGALPLDKAGATADFVGGLGGSGAWPAMGPIAKDDAPVMAAVKRGLQRFRFAVGKAELSLDHGRVSGRLLAPARATTASGGALDVEPAGRGYGVTLAGGGLPEVQADIRRVDFANGAVVAEGGVKAAFSLGLLDGAQVKADGRLRLHGGAVLFQATTCADVAVKRLDFGDNSAVDFAAQLCPARAPMVALAGGAWSLAGEARQ